MNRVRAGSLRAIKDAGDARRGFGSRHPLQQAIAGARIVAPDQVFSSRPEHNLRCIRSPPSSLPPEGAEVRARENRKSMASPQ
jgi:hypothetical protein